MQGLGLQFNAESIAKLKGDYDKIIKDLENRKINLDFNDINKSINELTNKVREIQGIKLQNILPVNIKQQIHDEKEALDIYKQFGTVDIKNKVFEDKSLKSFTVELERAKGIIDKIVYSAHNNEITGAFDGFKVNPLVKELDNSAKTAEQLVKNEQKLNNINIKQNTSELEKQLKILEKLEEKYQSLKYQPNTKQNNINNLKSGINSNLESLGNGSNIDDSAIEKTILEVEKLSKAYDRVNEKDQKEIKNRSEFYDTFIAKQKELNKLKIEDARDNSTENESTYLQERINSLTKQLDLMKNDKNGYYKKVVSSDDDYKNVQRKFNEDAKQLELHQQDNVYLEKQKQIYADLNKLQNLEFEDKKKIIGANEENTILLQKDLELIKQQQGKIGNVINNEELKNNELNNELIEKRIGLTKNLDIAQNKYNESLKLQEQNHQKYLNSLGENITSEKGIGFNVKSSSYQDMEKLAKSIGGVNAEIKKIDIQPITKGEEAVRKVTYQVKEGKDKWHLYTLSVSESAKTGEQSLRKLDDGTRDVINREIGLLGRLKNAWIAVASLKLQGLYNGNIISKSL